MAAPEDLRKIIEAKDDPLGAIAKYGDLAKLAATIGSDIEKGIATKKVEESRSKFGANRIPEPESKTLLELIFEGLQDKTLIMLIIASCVSLVLGMLENPRSGWIEGTAILFAVVLVVMVSSLNDYSKEQQFRKLNAKKNNKLVKVVRDGEAMQVSIYDVVVGDLVNIEVGDILCADGLFVSGFDLKCDDGAMTGEADAIKKDREHPILYSGCQVLEGMGRMLVVAVGTHSQSGSIMVSLQTEAAETPLQLKLSVLSDKIAKLGMISAFVIFLCLIAKLAYHIAIGEQKIDLTLAYALTKYIISSITVIVVAVPEGLPLAVTIALAYSMSKMLLDNNLVRHLDACETMGGASTICSDKTGTLTQNKMTVTKALFCNEVVEDVSKTGSMFSKGFMTILLDNIALNTAAYESRNEDGKKVMNGNRTDVALVNFCSQQGTDYMKVRADNPTVGLIPFSSKRKRMSTCVKHAGRSELVLYTKGASEIVLGLCTHVANNDGKIIELTKADRDEITSQISKFASETLRTICLAERPFKDDVAKLGDEDEKDLIFVGMVGIKDPIRPEVPAAVADCMNAGIAVRMVTGDNVTTATAIARECGIVTSDDDVIIEGPAFAKMTDEERIKIAPHLRVMARSSPQDKLTLVNTLKSLNHVVAVTGDGTNDAPALKSANVGFAMGIAGTEVSKEASDIILMDDNFTSIVAAVSWGRNVFDSIRKFLQFQLTVNLVAVAIAFFGSVINEHGESPLTPVQLLWVNLIMDTMAALALATDDPTPELLQRKPYGKHDGLITMFMWRNIVSQAIFQLIVILGVLFYGDVIFGVPKNSVEHTTVIFNMFVFCQVFNEINSRKLKDELNVFSGFFSNVTFVGIMIFTGVVQYLLVTFGGDFTTTRPLSLHQWGLVLGISALSLIVSFIVKLLLPLEKYVARTDEKRRQDGAAKEVEDALKEVKAQKAQARWAKIRSNVAKKEPRQSFASIVDVVRRKKRETIYGFSTKAQDQ